MAQSIACDLCGDESAVLMQTNLANGDSIAIGQACLITFSLANALSFSEGIPADAIEPYKDLMAGLCANLAPSMLALAKSSQPRAPRRKRSPDGAQGDADSPGDVAADASSADSSGGVSAPSEGAGAEV